MFQCRVAYIWDPGSQAKRTISFNQASESVPPRQQPSSPYCAGYQVTHLSTDPELLEVISPFVLVTRVSKRNERSRNICTIEIHQALNSGREALYASSRLVMTEFGECIA